VFTGIDGKVEIRIAVSGSNPRAVEANPGSWFRYRAKFRIVFDKINERLACHRLIERVLIALVTALVLTPAASYGLALVFGLDTATVLLGPALVLGVCAAILIARADPLARWRAGWEESWTGWRAGRPWAMIAVTAGSVGLYASLAIRFGLAGGDWVNWAWAAITVSSLAGFVLGSSALLRRSGVALPGLLGGLTFALVSLTMTGFTFYEVTGTIMTFHERLIQMIAVPFTVGAVGTLWRGNAAIGRRIARLAAVSSGLVLYLYSTLAVAVLGAGGPPDDPGLTSGGIVSDRLGNNLIDLLLGTLLTATVGWAGAASVARLRPGSPLPTLPGPFTPAASPDPQQEA